MGYALNQTVIYALYTLLSFLFLRFLSMNTSQRNLPVTDNCTQVFYILLLGLLQCQSRAGTLIYVTLFSTVKMQMSL